MSIMLGNQMSRSKRYRVEAANKDLCQVQILVPRRARAAVRHYAASLRHAHALGRSLSGVEPPPVAAVLATPLSTRDRPDRADPIERPAPPSQSESPPPRPAAAERPAPSAPTTAKPAPVTRTAPAGGATRPPAKTAPRPADRAPPRHRPPEPPSVGEWFADLWDRLRY